MSNPVLDKLVAELDKKYTPAGSRRPVIGFGRDMPKRNIIPCSTPALGYALSVGGWPSGQLIEFFGQAGAGKTTTSILALKDVLDFERAQGGDRVLAIVDVEHRFNDEWARQLGWTEGVDYILIQPTDAEAGTDMLSDTLKSGAVCGALWDSIGGAGTKASMETFSDKGTLFGGNAQVMKRNVQTIAPLANLFDVTVFYINQLREDMDGYNRPVTPGGRAVKHAMSLRIYLRPGSISTEQKTKYYTKLPEDDGIVQVGFPIYFKVVKNSFGPPNREQWSDFFYRPSDLYGDVGFSTEMDYVRLGALLGVVKKGGAWFNWRDLKSQGSNKFLQEIKDSGLWDEYKAEVDNSLSREAVGDDEGAPTPIGTDDVDEET